MRDVAHEASLAAHVAIELTGHAIDCLAEAAEFITACFTDPHVEVTAR
jgi:hypothetical protein